MNKPKRGCFGRLIRWAVIGVVLLVALGFVAQAVNPAKPTPRPTVVNVINTAQPSATAAPTDKPTTVPPSATPADEETAAILSALASRPDDYKIVFNNNRIEFQGTPSGDRNVGITVLSDTNDRDVNTSVALKIFQLAGNALPDIDVDRVIVDVRFGTKETNQSNVILYFSKNDVVEYSRGRLTRDQFFARREQ